MIALRYADVKSLRTIGCASQEKLPCGNQRRLHMRDPPLAGVWLYMRWRSVDRKVPIEGGDYTSYPVTSSVDNDPGVQFCLKMDSCD